MSSGQKAWAEELAEQAFEAKCQRLEAQGYGQIAETVERMDAALKRLERDLVALPRAGWATVDELKQLIKQLS